ncbi:hypothetical protein, partial [Mycobacterium tilburgii]|uniref:hypothetical protein n=1 Tax=Mycobacterium tilburgii TaxID=44467 RepID=UPI0021B4022A
PRREHRGAAHGPRRRPRVCTSSLLSSNVFRTHAGRVRRRLPAGWVYAAPREHPRGDGVATAQPLRIPEFLEISANENRRFPTISLDFA